MYSGAELRFGGPDSPELISRGSGSVFFDIEGGGRVYMGQGTCKTRFNHISIKEGDVAHGRPTLILDGVSFPTAMGIRMAHNQVGHAGALFEIRSGNVNLSYVNIGRYKMTTDILDEMRVVGGTTTCSGNINIGNYFVNNGKASGIYRQTAGQVTTKIVYVGSHTEQGGGGYFDLTGGTNTIQTSLEFYRDDNTLTADEFGTRQFVVSTNAVLRLTGAGMQATGTNPWLIDFSPATNEFDTSGTFVFDPSGVTTQTLLAFADDLGESLPQLTENTAIGVLDLSGLDGTERLSVVAASNFVQNAVYINKLTGLTPAEAATHMLSTLNIYYNGLTSTEMMRQQVALSGGGALIPLTPPPRGTMVLIK